MKEREKEKEEGEHTCSDLDWHCPDNGSGSKRETQKKERKMWEKKEEEKVVWFAVERSHRATRSVFGRIGRRQR